MLGDSRNVRGNRGVRTSHSPASHDPQGLQKVDRKETYDGYIHNAKGL